MMLSSNIRVWIFLACSISVFARFFDGECQNPSLQPDFTLDNYLGLWYMYYADPQTPFQENGNCGTAHYSPLDDTYINVFNAQIINGAKVAAAGRAYCEGSQCYVSFFADFFGDYRVVSTDFETYSIVYSCSRGGDNHRELLWILSRYRVLPIEDLEKIRKIIEVELPNWEWWMLTPAKHDYRCDYEGNIPS